MGIAGDLGTMSLADLLQWSAHSRKSGTLEVRRADTSKKILLDAGMIVAAATDDPREFLGQFLLARGKLTEEQLRQVLEVQQREGDLLGRILVGQGRLSAEELQSVLHAKFTDTVCNVFLWGEGSFRFDEEPLEPGEPGTRLELDAAYCVFEGIRRLDEWRQGRAVFPDDRMILAAGLTPLPRQQRASAAGRLVELAAAGMTIEEIALEMHALTSTVLADLRLLCERGYVRTTGRLKEVRPAGLDATSGPFGSESAEREHLYGGPLPPQSVPVLLAGLDVVNEGGTSPLEAFLLTRISGTWSVKDLVLVSPIKEIETLRSLKRLLGRGLIALSDT